MVINVQESEKPLVPKPFSLAQLLEIVFKGYDTLSHHPCSIPLKTLSEQLLAQFRSSPAMLLCDVV